MGAGSSWTEERFAAVGNGSISLCYQEMGDRDGEPIVLVMGLGTQMIAWDDGFCRLLADDATGLLDALELESAHVAGASMGGMIAQVLGYRHADRVRSLGLIMTGSGKRIVSMPRMRAMGTLMRDAPGDRDAYAEHAVRIFGVIGSPGFAPPDDRIRAHALLSHDRGHSRAGVSRQLHAITASGDRTPKLAKVRAPTVVIHGAQDPLVRPAAGRSVADSIPGAKLVMVPGMGHDLPAEVWPLVAGVLVANARGESRAATPEPDPVGAGR